MGAGQHDTQGARRAVVGSACNGKHARLGPIFMAFQTGIERHGRWYCVGKRRGNEANNMRSPLSRCSGSSITSLYFFSPDSSAVCCAGIRIGNDVPLEKLHHGFDSHRQALTMECRKAEEQRCLDLAIYRLREVQTPRRPSATERAKSCSGALRTERKSNHQHRLRS